MCCISCLSCHSMTGHVEFEIYNPVDNSAVGRIAKQWGGIAREVFTRADIWGLKYAPDMNLDTKSVLLAAVFLIVRFFVLFQKLGFIVCTFQYLSHLSTTNYFLFTGFPIL